MTTSPLRYPGGKGRMYNQIKEIMREHNLFNLIYVEPFSGGFGIGIQLLSNGDIRHAIINDADKHIYAFWYSVFFDTQRLISKIKRTEINIDNWTAQKKIYNEYNGTSLLKIGFAAFFLNRTNYSGVLRAGPLGGIKQEGKYTLDCRMNKEELIKRIENISEFRNSVEIYNMDALDFIRQVIVPRANEMFVNFDPPYVKKGRELYQNYYCEHDHIELSTCIKSSLQTVQWIMTYDDCDLIKRLYAEYMPEEYTLNHFAGKKKIGKELLIKNL